MLGVVDNDVDIYNYADDNTLVCFGHEYELVKSKWGTLWKALPHVVAPETRSKCFTSGKSGQSKKGVLCVNTFDHIT